MELALATWNIYWFGANPPKEGGTRTEGDLRKIGEVIRRLSPSVLALQEIVDAELLKQVLSYASGDGREYTIEAEGALLTSAPQESLDPAKGRQKVFFCYDRNTIAVRRWAPLDSPGSRKPLAADFWHEPSGTGFTAVAVHLQAGYPNFLDQEDAGRRRREAGSLRDWLTGRAADGNPAFPEPGYPRVVAMGDFNAELNLSGESPADPHGSLDPLREMEAQGWFVRRPQPTEGRWRTTLFANDRYVIDLMILSPGMADVTNALPSVYAWDFDPALGGPDAFRSGAAEFDPLKHYAVSDHRIVRSTARL